MAETVVNRGKYTVFNSGIPALTLRMCYFTGTQVGTNDPDLNTVADLEAVSGVTVGAERVALTSVTVTEDDVNNRVNVDAANLSFSAVAATAQGVAIYDEGGGTDATRPIIAIYTTGFPVVMDGGLNITITDWLRGV